MLKEGRLSLVSKILKNPKKKIKTVISQLKEQVLPQKKKDCGSECMSICMFTYVQCANA